MKIAILCAFILSASVATAETIIIEYPDHFYVESTGMHEGKLERATASSTALHSNTTPSLDNESVSSPSINESRASQASARPVTNFGAKQQPVSSAERRASMQNEIERQKREHSELMKPHAGETPDQADSRQKVAAGKLKKINKLATEILKIPVHDNDQSN